MTLAESAESFLSRHIGVSAAEEAAMLEVVGSASLDALLAETIPPSLRSDSPLELPAPASEAQAQSELRDLISANIVVKSFIGQGYYGTITPAVILRNVLENPGWYTAYTPYQAEIAQGRLEALFNFQTVVAELTGLPIANASLLDEATAAAEAMQVLRASHGAQGQAFYVSEACHPQTIDVVRTRAAALGIKVILGTQAHFAPPEPCFGALVQYPRTDGRIDDLSGFTDAAHGAGTAVAVATDLLALTLLRPPGEWGADIAIGSSQRFGVPLGLGGPHAAFFAARTEYTRLIPGRIIGLSKDDTGQSALRMALQTREQHIRREKATSNICTAQVLLAVMASMYAVYHGADGLTAIARRIHHLAATLERELRRRGFRKGTAPFFDTITVEAQESALDSIMRKALAKGYNLRRVSPTELGIALDETATPADIEALLDAFGEGEAGAGRWADANVVSDFPMPLRRTSLFLRHPVFTKHRTEHEMLRYIRALEGKDLSLTHSMIPLGSCTMKLNPSSAMQPLSWPGVSEIHPFAPPAQWKGYATFTDQLAQWLCSITGLGACSLMPNSGAQGEYAGLLVIRRFHETQGQPSRNVCLIPASSHGTNPASAAMANLQVVVVATDSRGNIDMGDLQAKIATHRNSIAALMVTYPSTHGVFEETITDICTAVHQAGGLVYLDGANMNAQVGLCRPADYGADVCHLNLHKTFAIPHGGGGPGMGPICVRSDLAPLLPRHRSQGKGSPEAIGPIAAAPLGSASVLSISWMYARMLGASGLKRASEIAILNANYVARRLERGYPLLFKGKGGRVAHECIIDLRQFKESAGVEAEDVAKRLMDYGFHAPTVAFPVAGTLMIEPTESESKAELDRFCDAMLAIREEIADVESGRWPRGENPLKRAPHTAGAVCADHWDRPYARSVAAYPLPWVRDRKFWPSVGRVNNVFGDRKLVPTRPMDF